VRAPLVVAVAYLAAGIGLGLQRPIPAGGGPLCILAALGGLVALWRFGGRAVPGALLLAGALLGTTTRTAATRSCEQWIPEDSPLEVVGVVRQAGAPGGAGSERLRLRIDSVRVAGAARGSDGPLLVACGAEVPARWDGGAQAGARVRGWGRWWSPPGARPGLTRPGALLLDTLVVVEGRSERRAVEVIREAGLARIEAVFPRHAPLVSSLLLARRDGLDSDVRDRYARAGLSHLLAISGLHVGLVAGILLLLTRALRLGSTRAPVVAAAGTVAYVALLGAPHSAARAALQIVLVLAARALQRPTRTEALIAAAAMVLLAADPGALARPGFQLSFAGVAGILALRRPMLARLDPLARATLGGLAGPQKAGAGKAVRWVADGLATSVAATVATAPIVAWHFGRVAPVGIAANLVAIPLLTAAVPALALALAAGTLWLPAGRFLAGAGGLLLDLLDRTAAVAAGVPFGTVAVVPGSAFVLTAAVMVGYAGSRRLGRVRPVVRGVVWASAAVAVLMVAPLRPAGDRVEIHLIDVGQGDAIGIRSPGGRWLVVDAGLARNDYDAGAARVVPYLQGRGVRRIEGLVVTHADADHMGGAGAVLRSLRPRWAGGPAVVVGKPQYLALLHEARSAAVPWVAVRRGMELTVDGMTLSFLFPGGDDVAVEDANDASVVMRVAYGEFAALLTGDAPARVEAALVDRLGPGLDADVLKVGHHGSSTSTTAELLAATGAGTALISAGRGNRYGHPHAAVVARLQQRGLRVYRTDRHGTVVVRAGADGALKVETERAREAGPGT